MGRITTVNIDEYALELYNAYRTRLGLPPRSRILNYLLTSLVDNIRRAIEDNGIRDGDIIDIAVEIIITRNNDKKTYRSKTLSIRV